MYQPHPIKRFLPKTLFGRALLILVAPSLLLQILLVYLFYERHWDSVVRNMSYSLAGSVELVYREYMNQPSFEQVQAKASMLGMKVWLESNDRVVIDTGTGKYRYPEFHRQLSDRLQLPVMVETQRDKRLIVISLLVDDGVLRLETSQKRIASGTTYIFLMWSAGSSAVLLLIATLFLRNQIRPIRALALAAERFGLGQEVKDFRPAGAREVRQAGRAFMVMRNRLQRQVNTRTEMLAGISHDLRTPLTRMKLQLAMLSLKDAQRAELETDITEMEHMIDEYLQFARGDEKEPSVDVALSAVVKELVANYERQGSAVKFTSKTEARLNIRVNAMRRALQNIINNALRYGEEAIIITREEGAYLVISVRDKGPGIPVEQTEEAFRPFTRLDPSRSQNTSGAGLGLSITRDIIQSHGGTIELRNLKKGLEVLINLPKRQQENTP